jgi:hypothetical protein
MIPTILVLLAFNILCHIFLNRFFAWYDASASKGRKIFLIFMLIPPLSIVVSLSLIILGSILHISEKIRKK